VNKKLLNDLKGGITVWSYNDAVEIRKFQKEHPTWINIISNIEELEHILGVKFDGTKTLPYFGAILTGEGKAAFQNK